MCKFGVDISDVPCSAIFSQVEILVLLKKISKGELFGCRFGVVSMLVYLGVALSPRTGALGYNFD